MTFISHNSCQICERQKTDCMWKRKGSWSLPCFSGPLQCSMAIWAKPKFHANWPVPWLCIADIAGCLPAWFVPSLSSSATSASPRGKLSLKHKPTGPLRTGLPTAAAACTCIRQRRSHISHTSVWWSRFCIPTLTDSLRRRRDRWDWSWSRDHGHPVRLTRA